MRFGVSSSDSESSASCISDPGSPVPLPPPRQPAGKARRAAEPTARSSATPVPQNAASPSPFARPRSPSILRSPHGLSRRSSILPPRRSQHEQPSSDDDTSLDDDPEDSEEEAFPVSKRGLKPYTYAADPFSSWMSHERSSAYLSSLTSAAMRRQHLEQIHTRLIQASHSMASQRAAHQVDQITGLLGQVQLAQSQESRVMAESFSARETKRLREIDHLIKLQEQKEAQVVIEARRKREAEAAAKAEAERVRLAAEQRQQQEAKLQEEKAQEARQSAQKLANEEIAQQKMKEESSRLALKAAEARAAKQAGGEAKIEYERWMTEMNRIKTVILPAVSANPEWKSICRNAKRQITPKVGQLTNSAAQVTHVIQDIQTTLQKARSVANEPYIWLLNHLSKALIKQAEEEVTSHASSVFPLARLVLGLFVLDLPSFPEVLMARLTKKCPFITCYRPLIKLNQTNQEYTKQLGFKPNEDTFKYSDRMSGIISLYAAICSIDPRSIVPSLSTPDHTSLEQKIPIYFRYQAAWTWMSRILKEQVIDSRPVPQLIATFLETLFEVLKAVYGQQWIKLCGVLLVRGIREGQAKFHKDSKPMAIRLEGLLEEIESTGSLKGIKGRKLDP